MYVGTTGRPTTSSVAAGSWWARVTRSAMTASSTALFGARRPTLTHWAVPAGREGGAAAGFHGHDRCGRDDRGATEVRHAQLPLVIGRHSQPECGAGCQLPQLGLGQQLVTGQAVVPGRVVLRRRDVVVVHDQGLRSGSEPRSEARRRGELVEQDVACFGVLGVAGERPRLRLGLWVGPLDVEVRADPAPGQDVAQAQRVPSHGVALVQHRDELVHGGHDGTAPRPARATRRLTKRSAAAARSSSARRRRPAAIMAARRGASARSALMEAASA